MNFLYFFCEQFVNFEGVGCWLELEFFGNSTEQLGGSVNGILTNCERNVNMLATTHSPNLFLISENETQSFF